MKIHNDKSSINNEILKNIKNTKDKNKDKNKIGTGEINHSKSASTDSVNLSSKAKKLHKITGILKETPDIREEKISELKQSIKKGTYQTDSKKIAEKVILESLE